MDVKNYIHGIWKPAISGQSIPLYNPAEGRVYGQVPLSQKEDVLEAITSAKAAYTGWKSKPVEERSKIIATMADLIDERFDEFAKAESIDNGKPLWLCKKVDIPRASANLRFFANAMLQFHNESYDMDGTAINYTLRHPLGVVACISPWNLPLYLFTWKIAPALVAGNCVIGKPSEVTPYTAYLLTQVAHDAGLPHGVLNIINGPGDVIGHTLTTHPEVKAISFTGSTRVGKAISELASPLFKKVSLEMGGKNPNIVFDDCNYDKALKTTLNSSFSNQGQICLCGSRIYVQSGLYERFKKDFVAATKALKVGHPLHHDTKIGAVVSEAHLQKILSYIDIAKSEGGSILCGGERVIIAGHEQGYYIAPTIIEGLDENCRTNQEEIFGPVVTIQPFDTYDEAVQLANRSSYGLSCTIWTQDITTAHKLSAEVEAGIVWVNTWLNRDLRTPFGGMKNSGVGREGGYDALKFFTEIKNVCIALL